MMGREARRENDGERKGSKERRGETHGRTKHAGSCNMADAPTHYLSVADNCAISSHSPLRPLSSSPLRFIARTLSSPRASSTFGNLSFSFVFSVKPTSVLQVLLFRCLSLSFSLSCASQYRPIPCILLPPASTWHPLTSFIFVSLSLSLLLSRVPFHTLAPIILIRFVSVTYLPYL